jgi:hypothetical protein
MNTIYDAAVAHGTNYISSLFAESLSRAGAGRDVGSQT